MIDTHCHLYLEDFREDVGEVISRAAGEGVKKFYLPSIDSATMADLLSLEAAYPDACFAMMGLHPGSVKENYREELLIVENWLFTRHFAAVGEVGLDYYWDTRFVAEQVIAFDQQISWALQLKIPVVIHSRNALEDFIARVKERQQGDLRGIFHCFGGTSASAREIIDAGFYLGIGGVLTYKRSGLTEVLADISLEHMVLETDSPYLTPVPFRGKRNESSYLKYIVARLAEVKGVSIEEVEAVTTANAEKIFGS